MRSTYAKELLRAKRGWLVKFDSEPAQNCFLVLGDATTEKDPEFYNLHFTKIPFLLPDGSIVEACYRMSDFEFMATIRIYD